MASKITFPRQISSFALVGIFSFAIDISLFNIILLIFQVYSGETIMVFVSKIFSGIVATLAAWWGNRKLTFASNNAKISEVTRYFIVGIIGITIPLLCLFTSRNVFGFTDILSDNISANFFGLFAATLFRFVAYKYWVFRVYGNQNKH